MFDLPESSNFKKNLLGQGDIINNIFLFGALNKNSLLTLNDHNQKPNGWQVNKPPETGPAIVLSHSCELDRISNGVKVTSIILASLRDINNATKPDKISELIETNLVTEASNRSYLKYFYIEQLNILPFPQGSVVDFSKLFSYRNQSYDYLLENKIAQLRPEIAEKFALKLALFFYRKAS